MTTVLISEKEVARMLGCTPYKLQRDRRLGAGIQYHKIGRSVRYDRAAVLQYIAAHEFRSTSEY